MWQRLPTDLTSLKLCWVYQEIEASIWDIDSNQVAILDESDWSPIDSFWSDVANT
jgi:glucose dehydrogenase